MTNEKPGRAGDTAGLKQTALASAPSFYRNNARKLKGFRHPSMTEMKAARALWGRRP